MTKPAAQMEDPVLAGGAVLLAHPDDVRETAQAPPSFDSQARFLDKLLHGLQFPIGLLIGVVCPALLRLELERFRDAPASYANSLLATVVAFLVGYCVLRKVTSFPGVRASNYVFPSFAGGYFVTMMLFWGLSIDYSRVQFFASLVMTTAIFMAVLIARQRLGPVRLCLAPGGDTERVKEFGSVVWRDLSSPEEAPPGMPVIADLRADLGPDWERFIVEAAISGRPVHHWKDVYESLSGRVQIEHLSENTFGAFIPSSIYASAKRSFDFVLAIVSLAQLAVFFMFIGALIRLDSKGPAIFRQQRIGFRGKPFTVYKFRTMRETTKPDSSVVGQMTAEDDARITRLGRFLRRTRIDELPQIFNILKGEMSWIGPRPEAMLLSQWYETQIPFYRYRHAVRPGVTGWAQVNQGHVTSIDDVDVKLQYDLYYVKHFSIWLDLLVILRTFRVVFTGKGAK